MPAGLRITMRLTLLQESVSVSFRGSERLNIESVAGALFTKNLVVMQKRRAAKCTLAPETCVEITPQG